MGTLRDIVGSLFFNLVTNKGPFYLTPFIKDESDRAIAPQTRLLPQPFLPATVVSLALAGSSLF